MTLDDLPTDRETQPGPPDPVTDCLGSPRKPFEDTAVAVRPDPDAMILHLDPKL